MRDAQSHGLKRIVPPGSWSAARTPRGSSRNLGWSLDALSGDRNDTARATEPVGRREVGARNTSDDAGELGHGEPRRAKERAGEQARWREKMTETSGSQDISTKLQRIAKLAKEIRGATLKTLAHHIDVDWLREAYRRTRKGGAPGLDGVSAKQYAEHL